MTAPAHAPLPSGALLPSPGGRAIRAGLYSLTDICSLYLFYGRVPILSDSIPLLLRGAGQVNAAICWEVGIRCSGSLCRRWSNQQVPTRRPTCSVKFDRRVGGHGPSSGGCTCCCSGLRGRRPAAPGGRHQGMRAGSLNFAAEFCAAVAEAHRSAGLQRVFGAPV